ncbi:hypothetical protein E8E14_009808 [Neopestalotiopsis sp. 37M]|nr:hypothetical protein E8E14_009808 [Neopestalotiopsis sp. 37M]
MSYEPLSSKDPHEHRSYGSTDSSAPAPSPAALLIENVVLEDFERPQASNPFLDPETAAYWRQVYDGCEYECRHVFDPTLTWSRREEQDLVRKLDWKVCLWATKTWFRPNGWFTPREEAIVVNRVLRDDPSKGDMHNREALTPRKLWEAVKDFDLWPLYVIGLVAYIPQSPPKTYITLILRSLGFSVWETNLLTIPSDILHICNLVFITRLSEWLNERALVAILQPIWTLPCIFALRFWDGTFDNAWGSYALVMILLSYPYCHAILVGWTSKNSNNVGTRTVSAALYNMSVQTGSVFSAYVYRDDDKPLYRRGHSTLLLINVVSILVFLLTKLYYVCRNRQKEAQWNALSEHEKVEYRRVTKIQGSRRLDFRFAH